ncbi:hypothetical protein BRETT_001896 [Brettanomyces bruxellensis]|uniref:Uncharacterized protein n=1 Tax=Dekkera bruxellensis TaxID=5007 RepID=A0A871R3P0_DEKBR|nr:uncharacterized protein BRETT_001896 [Brettanomyces bruxellensis]QOU18825.1 hypothetical protein BRETT_001896 [Brettanomyces bruxellensis]
MPFKFLATLSSASSKSLWTRSIYALSTASDVIKITFRQKIKNSAMNDPRANYPELLLTAVNITKTSSLNCSFRSNFFSTFTIDGYLPDESTPDDCNMARCFSILVNSKTLNVLFKDCGENSKTFKLLLIHENSNEKRDRIFSNKLFIELETKAGMTKRYSVNFRIGKESFDLRVEHIYLEMLKDQSLTDNIKEFRKGSSTDNKSETNDTGNRVHQIILETSILRNFIAMFSNTLEDFKIEMYPNARKIQFHGFNRQKALSARTKLTPLSNQPMSLSIQVSLNDLIYDNIMKTSDTNSKMKDKFQVSFRLRYMRTFIQLIGNDYSFHDSSIQTHDHSRDILNGIGNNYCELLLIGPAFPIVFDRKYREDDISEDGPVCCEITLIAATDSETDKVDLNNMESVRLRSALDNSHSGMKRKNGLTYLESVKKLELARSGRNPSTNGPLFVPLDGSDFESADTDQQEIKSKDALIGSDDVMKNSNIPTESSKTEKNLHIKKNTKVQNKNIISENMNGENEEFHKGNKDYDSIFWDNVKYHRAAINRLETEVPLIKNKNKENDGDKEKEEDHITQLLGPTQKNTFKGVFGN